MEPEVSRRVYPKLPQPQADEILFVSKFRFHVMDSGTMKILRTAERNVDELWPGSVFFLVGKRASFTTWHIQGDGYDDVYCRPKVPINLPVIGETIDLDTADGLKRLEVSATIWEYSQNLILGHNVFPSDLDLKDAGKTVVYAESLGQWTTLAYLEEHGQWTIYRNSGGLVAKLRF